MVLRMKLRFETLEMKAFVYASIILTLVLILNLLSRRRKKKIYEFMASLPGPVCFPFIGCGYTLMTMGQTDMVDFLRTQIKLYPRICRYWFFHKPYICVSERKILSAVLNSFQCINKSAEYTPLTQMGAGIFTHNGTKWRKLRKQINPCFRTDVIATFGETFSRNTRILLDALQELADDGKSFDLFPLLNSFTIDLVFENFMGCSINMQKERPSDIPHHVLRALEIVLQRCFNFLEWPDLYWQLSGKQKKIDELIAPLKHICREVLQQQLSQIRKTRKSDAQLERKPLQFIEVLLNNIDAGDLDLDEAVEEVIDMTAAGSLTTAMSNAWSLKVLASHPDLQEKAHQEVFSINQGKEIKFEQLSQLVYVEAVIKETMRHFGALVTGRDVLEDLQVDEKTTIPAGVSLLLALYELHHDPELWKNPTKFYPEHFLPELESLRPKGSFLPFLVGPRNCPGNKYAMQSMKYVLANTILHFEFLPVETLPEDLSEMECNFALFLVPKSGFNVYVKKRRTSQFPADSVNTAEATV
ncbi:unnamed protein product [Bemisia tabaci]|uniref:Cytochrome P450 n=1 Tax=Bemisia tabaci TaxID=7038 RepID=A0A9P0F0W7_BEMTA|nr:unnamed protein product [Bemisia tabaci]